MSSSYVMNICTYRSMHALVEQYITTMHDCGRNRKKYKTLHNIVAIQKEKKGCEMTKMRQEPGLKGQCCGDFCILG